MDLALARVLKARALLARMDRLLEETAAGLIFGGQPRDRSALTRLGGLLRQHRAERKQKPSRSCAHVGPSEGDIKKP